MKLILSLALLASLNSFATNTRLDGVYGPDNRVDYHQAKEEHKKLASLTAAMIDKSLVNGVNLVSNVYTLQQRLEAQFGVRACSDTKFLNQPLYSNCSGSLIAPNVLLTAGHCIKTQEDCADYNWIFEYRVLSSGNFSRHVPEQTVYSCKKIISRDLNATTGQDYAVILLDRSTGKAGLNYRWNGKVDSKVPVMTIGTPYGLPLKITTDAMVRDNSIKNYFITNLDTFAGNSGSPVFDMKDLLIEGILVRGDTDYAIDTSRNCATESKCSETGCRGEHVSRITSVPEVSTMERLYWLIAGGTSANEMNIPQTFWVDFPLPDGTALIHYAVANNKREAIIQLLEKGADINLQNLAGYSPIFSLTNDHETLKLLIENGANVEARAINGETPLLTMARLNRHEQVKLLMKAGANWRAKDNSGRTIFKHYADKPDQLEELKALGLTDPSSTPATTSNRYTLLGRLFLAGTLPNLNVLANQVYKGRCYVETEPDKPRSGVFGVKKLSDGTFVSTFYNDLGSTNVYDSWTYDQVFTRYPDLINKIQSYDTFTRVNFSNARISQQRVLGNMIIQEMIKDNIVEGRCYFFITDGLEHL